MRRIAVLTLLLFIAFVPRAQKLEWEWEKSVKNVKGTIKILSEEITVIVPDDNSSQRYIAQNLPAEYKKEGLKVTFSGMVGKIPPNVRMMGTPFKLSKVCVSRKEKKKYKLAKGSYNFK